MVRSLNGLLTDLRFYSQFWGIIKKILPLLSKYKSELMGFSMLLIMAFHTAGGIPIPFIDFKPFLCGDIGVEFFLILSAMGCYFSLYKNQNILAFYRRRVIRLIPTFIISVAITIIASHWIGGSAECSWSYFFRSISFVALAGGDISYWFIAHILVCYLTMPLLYKWSSYKWYFPLCCVAVFIIFGFSYVQSKSDNAIFNVMLCRYPIFLISVSLAIVIKANIQNYLSVANIKITISLTLALLSYILITEVHSSPFSKYLLFFVFSIPMLVSVAMVMHATKLNVVKRTLAFIGSISLELYLIHSFIMLPLSDLITTNVLIRFILSYASSIIGAYALHRLVSCINKIIIH